MKKYFSLIFSFAVMAGVIVIDQLTKMWTVKGLVHVGASYKLIPEVLHFTYVQNRGAGMGILADHRWVFMTVSCIAIAAIIGFIIWKRPSDKLLLLSLALIAGGGVGNMIDRVALGYVVDMINVECIDFYVFNVADSAVCIGCGVMILYMILDEVREYKKKKAEKSQA